MLRQIRFSLSIAEPGSGPTRKEWIYPKCSLIPEGFSTEDSDDADEYIQEWNFPYPGQSAFPRVDPAGLVNNVALMQKMRLQGGRRTYSGQSRVLLQRSESILLVSSEK
ncbi:hypothetical protein [Endozoicomonas sp. YOMI1]|uniref:hypothetical protein n=1 Tax=Endozoicomonas sp. YOMI1 TaxID=2828739 RepID=UPI00214952A2|nr:hypothetical protein [Endozoicomonas sp. YOMI1]